MTGNGKADQGGRWGEHQSNGTTPGTGKTGSDRNTKKGTSQETRGGWRSMRTREKRTQGCVSGVRAEARQEPTAAGSAGRRKKNYQKQTRGAQTNLTKSPCEQLACTKRRQLSSSSRRLNSCFHSLVQQRSGDWLVTCLGKQPTFASDT